MKPMKVLAAAAAALMAAATVIAPPAQALLHPGNYDLLTNRYDRASWVWFVARCNPAATNRRWSARIAPAEVLRLLHGKCVSGQWAVDIEGGRTRRSALPRLQHADA